MSIEVNCNCGRGLLAPEELAGGTGSCPGCGRKVSIPGGAPAPAVAVNGSLPKLALAKPDPEQKYEWAQTPLRHTPSAPAKPAVATRREPVISGEIPKPTFWRFAYLLLILALLPLGWQTLHAQPLDPFWDSFWDGLTRSEADPLLKSQIEQIREEHGSLVEFERKTFEALPAHRLIGALLPFDTGLHWVMGLLSEVLLLACILLLFESKGQSLWQLLRIALLISAIGLLLLMTVQILGDHVAHRANGEPVSRLDRFSAQSLGYAYAALDEPCGGFFVSLLGFIFGVGLVQEMIKAIPILWRTRSGGAIPWRSALLWGLAAGVGFGAAEGIVYASRLYNGIDGMDIYLTRFISCVVMQAVWSGAGAINLARNNELIERDINPAMMIYNAMYLISLPILMHGLFATLFKLEYDGLALAIALMSFIWLAALIERARRSEYAMHLEEAWGR